MVAHAICMIALSPHYFFYLFLLHVCVVQAFSEAIFLVTHARKFPLNHYSNSTNPLPLIMFRNHFGKLGHKTREAIKVGGIIFVTMG